MLTQDALAKAKALEVQVQAATFTKLEHDLSEDAAALRAWAKAEETRLSSVDAMVLNHKRRRYVQGLAKVREFSEERLRVRQCQPSELEVQLANFRRSTSESLPVNPGNRPGQRHII